MLPFVQQLLSQGKADIALTCTDHTNVSGFGYLGRTGIVIVDNVGARQTATPPFVVLPLSISNVTAVTASEYYIAVAANAEDVAIDTSGTTGIYHASDLNGESISVFPNPAKDKIVVHSRYALLSVEVYNATGKKVADKKITASELSHSLSLNLENLNAGFYLLKLNTEKGSVTKKVSVVKN